jgi:hypothetical protein
LVTFVNAHYRPVHRWFPFKEGFHPDLLVEICRRFSWRPLTTGRLVDPFVGSGTTLLSAQMNPGLGIKEAIGIEHNPFLAFVANTKTNWGELNPSTMGELYRKLISEVTNQASEVPFLTTFRRQDIFPSPVLKDLLSMRHVIWHQSEIGKSKTVDAAWLCLASVIERVANFRKDGRALRIVHQEMPKLSDAFKEMWTQFVFDIAYLQDRQRKRRHAATRVIHGDGIELKSYANPEQPIEPESTDLFFYSPPYLNMSDYTEVYKVEAALLGFMENYGEFRAIRQGTVRSHPSIQFNRGRNVLDELGESSRIGRLLTELEDFLKSRFRDTWHKRTATVVMDYFDDMFRSLTEQFVAAAPGALIVCVVANSVLSSRSRSDDQWTDDWVISVPTDAILASFAMELGLQVQEILVARELVARNAHATRSRESVLVMQKSAKSR